MSKTVKWLFIAAIVLNFAMVIISVYFGAWWGALLNGSTAIFVWVIYCYAMLFHRQSKMIVELRGENCELLAKLHKERMKNVQWEMIDKLSIREVVEKAREEAMKLMNDVVECKEQTKE